MAELVDCTGLENRHTRNGIVGSNPSASANYVSVAQLDRAIHF